MCKNGKEIYRLQKHPDQLINLTELGESGFFSLLDGMRKILNKELTFSGIKIVDVSNIHI